MMEAEMKDAEDGRKPPEAGKRQGSVSPWDLPRGGDPAHTVISDFWPPDL